MRFEIATGTLFTLAACGLLTAEEKAARPENRLAKESSPYLRQHARNPVDWYPWGPEAFAKAKNEGKLIFLSIGYSSCHWCHVMERESFENKEIAKILNDSFVCIKVDREERPDIDEIYMTALHVMRQSGGWPLSMFLLPDGRPVIGGTYWPPDDRQIQGETVRGFKSILKLVLQIYKERPKEVAEQAAKLADLTQERLNEKLRGTVLAKLDRTVVDEAVEGLLEEFDDVHGGFGRKDRAFRGPKFPVPSNLLLLQRVANDPKHKGTQAKIDLTLDRMARGGIFDQVGGGFHRYSTERTWTVPHFEKMLYDNAQLAEVYARAARSDGKGPAAQALRQTLDFVLREMTSADGAFWSALDADSEGEEGRFYVWTNAELERALPDKSERDLARRVFGVERGPNFEEKFSILTLPKPLAEFAAQNQLSGQDLDAKLDAIRQKLFASRAKRPRPFLDTKVITAWNGQMIAGFAVAGAALRQPTYVAAAEKAAEFALKNLRTAEGRLLRTYFSEPGKRGVAKLNGYLDDYAFLVHGLLALHDATGQKRWLDEARVLTDLMVRWHWDEKNSGFFYTSHDHEKLFARSKDQYDGAQPCGNSMAARNLVRLWQRTGDDKYRTLARKQFEAFTGSLKSNPTALTTMVLALADFVDAGGFADQAPIASSKKEPGKAVRSDSVVRVAAAVGPMDGMKQVVTVTLDIDKGWHIYANPVGNETLENAKTVAAVSGKGNPRQLSVEYPKPTKIEDKLVGDYLVYAGKVTIKVTLERGAGDKEPLDVAVRFMACEEGSDGKPGKCLLPATVKLSVK